MSTRRNTMNVDEAIELLFDDDFDAYSTADDSDDEETDSDDLLDQQRIDIQSVTESDNESDGVESLFDGENGFDDDVDSDASYRSRSHSPEQDVNHSRETGRGRGGARGSSRARGRGRARGSARGRGRARTAAPRRNQQRGQRPREPPVQPVRDATDPAWRKEYDFMARMINAFDDSNCGPVRHFTEEQLNEMQALDFFRLFISDDVFQLLADETERYAGQVRHEAEQAGKPHKEKWETVTVEEIKAFLGLTITMGIIRLPTLHMYWRSDGLFALKRFGDVMPRDRFKQIKRYFHLADRDRQPARDSPNYDLLYKVKRLLDTVIPKFKEMYKVNKNLAIDEAMIPFKGRLSIKQYIKAKPHKWGIKSWVLSESETGYVDNFQIYKGRQENAPREGGLARRVVRDLTVGMDNTYHAIFTDNFYTSGTLADDMTARGLYLCGTLRKNAAGVPKSLFLTPVEIRNSERGLYWWFAKDGKVVGMWFDNRPVYILSTFHPPKLDRPPPHDLPTVRRHEKNGNAIHVPCPPAIVEYIRCMRGVDRGDQIIMMYNSGRKSVKWWKRVFFYLLEVCILNAHVIETVHRKKHEQRTRAMLKFKMELAEGLIDGQIFRRRVGRPSIGDAHESQRLENVGLHMPVFSDRVHDCRACNERISRAGGICGHGASKDRAKMTYDNDRHRTRIKCSHCDVALCLNRERNCFQAYHTQKKYW